MWFNVFTCLRGVGWLAALLQVGDCPSPMPPTDADPSTSSSSAITTGAEPVLSATLAAAASPAAGLVGDSLFSEGMAAYGDYAPLAADGALILGISGISTADVSLASGQTASIGALAGAMAELQVLGQGGMADGAATTLAAYAVQPLSVDLSLSGGLLPLATAERLLG